jgi:hypothetical protein
VSCKPTKACCSARRRVFVAASADSSPAAYRVRASLETQAMLMMTLSLGARRAGSYSTPRRLRRKTPALGRRRTAVLIICLLVLAKTISSRRRARGGIVRGILDDEIALTPGSLPGARVDTAREAPFGRRQLSPITVRS